MVPTQRHKTRAATRIILAATVALLVDPVKAAQQDEIQVYDDGVNKKGEFVMELHVNGTPKGNPTPSFPGEYLTDRGIRVSPEFSYGLGHDMDAGLYMPELAVDKDGNWLVAGAKLRLKWLPVHAEQTGGFFAGGNIEVSRLNGRVAQSRSQAELRLISGYRASDWLLAFDPIFNWSLSDGFANATPDFNYGVKLTHKIVEGLDMGAEYYSDIGPIDHPKSFQNQDNRIYGVMDIDMKPVVMNIGVGYGLTDASDRWTLKTSFEVPLH